MGITRYIIGLCTLPNVILAQDLACTGQDPVWELRVTDQVATFTFDRTSTMDIMQDDLAINADHTRALTLVGPRDSAILITTTSACENNPLQATVLTQRGQSPIILTGCCALQPR